MCYSLSDIYLPIFLVTTSYLSFVRYLDGIKIKHSGSQFELHTHSCVRVMNINRNKNIFDHCQTHSINLCLLLVLKYKGCL